MYLNTIAKLILGQTMQVLAISNLIKRKTKLYIFKVILSKPKFDLNHGIPV